MTTAFNPNRYAVINEKNPREIIMLRGSGCTWRRCRFCDYHLDASRDEAANYALNARQIAQVTGIHRKLEVINSGSFPELDEQTMMAILQRASATGICEVHFECHWQLREAIPALRARFAEHGIAIVVKIGIETFDARFREAYLDKGIPLDTSPTDIAAYFDECCLLFGIPGQTSASMHRDLTTGLAHFQRVCVNIMQDNAMPIPADPAVIEAFLADVYPLYKTNPRVDILLENTAFGVGGVVTHAQ